MKFKLNKYIYAALFACLFLGATQWYRTLVIGSSVLSTPAIFEVVSISKGSISAPKMTEAQRDAIGSPTTGLQVFNTDTNKLDFYNGSIWGGVDAGFGLLSAKTADYTVLDGDGIYVVLMTTGATDRTVTLPTASANTDRVLCIKKVDTGAGDLTVDGEGAEVIDGVTTKLIVMPSGTLCIAGDGTGWHTTSVYYGDTITEAWTDNQANATTSVRVFRVGPLVIARGRVSYTGAQSGNFILTIPTAYTSTDNNEGKIGITTLLDAGTATYHGFVSTNGINNQLEFRPHNVASTYLTSSVISSTVPFTWANTDKMDFYAQWQVSGW